METLSDPDFAGLAAENVAYIARKVHEKWQQPRFPIPFSAKHKNLVKLSNCLENVSFGGQEEELEKFSDVLESACTYPEVNPGKTPEARFPTLEVLVATNPAKTAGSATDEKHLRKIGKSVEAFASTRNYYLDTKRHFRFLEDLTKKHAEAQHKSRDAKTTKLAEDESYPRHVLDKLFNAVRKYGVCCGGHGGRLELDASVRTEKNEIVFHTVFSKTGPAKLAAEMEWQHMQLLIKRRRRERVCFPPNVAAGDDTDDATSDDAADASEQRDDVTEVTSPSKFCDHLSEDIGPASMFASIQDDVLRVLPHRGYVEVNFANEQSISLADALKDSSLAPKITGAYMKLLLAYIVAKSCWQFYDSDFMSDHWTTETIQLFREQRHEHDDAEPGIDWTPYHAFSTKQTARRGFEERLPSRSVLHRYPRVLALAKILYELGRKTHNGPSAGSASERLSDANFINETANTIWTGVKRKNWPHLEINDRQTVADYRAIVESCVGQAFFQLNNSESGAQERPGKLEEKQTVEERRAILFQKVVAPLKAMAQAIGWVDASGNIKRSLVRAEVAEMEKEVGQEPRSAALLNDAPAMSQTEAEAWLNKLTEKGSAVAEICDEFLKKKQLKDKRIRIAVLDTGYDPDAIFFNGPRRRRLIRWKDYVEADQLEAKDEDGHGTHVVSVLMRVAPAADICVARIARDTSGLQDASKNVAALTGALKAIRWAWHDCRADIVTMSFGFRSEVLVDGYDAAVSNAMSEALTGRNQCILFFAAFGNDGGNAEEMFPATSQHVFSIRATDHSGELRGPASPWDSSAMCFTTLGKDVPGASLQKSRHEGALVCKTGSSVATPIAAGLAAMVLGYARIHEEALQETLRQRGAGAELAKLWRMPGMSAMFETMARRTNGGLYLSSTNKFTDATTVEARLERIRVAVTDAKG